MPQGDVDAKSEEGTGMAKLQRSLRGDYDEILRGIEDGILRGSISAELEDTSVFRDGDTRCTVLVFERYSWFGRNRLSLTVSLFRSFDGQIRLSAISAGGSQAMFWKINTVGEEAFIEKLDELLSKHPEWTAV